MISKLVHVNGTEFRVTLTEHVVSQVGTLKSLYSTAYEDPESFDEVSAEISSTVQDIASSVEPAPADGDLDDLIQEIIKIVDNKAAEVQKELEEKPTKKSKKLVKK